MFYIKIVKLLHSIAILDRRVNVLSKNIISLIPPKTHSVLDIGCGDGKLSALILKGKPGILVTGLEVLKRKKCEIKYKVYDGIKIPLEGNSVDLCLLVDILHHTFDIPQKIKEVKRVSRKYIIIKDHIYSNLFDYVTLKFMDWVGNRPYGVNLIYNYQTKRNWISMFKQMDLKVVKWNENLPIYPWPFDKAFGKELHFTVLLEKKR